MGHAYAGFTPPEDPSRNADWCIFLDNAVRFRSVLEQYVPKCQNASEALMRLDKAVMVAVGAFHVHPR